MPGKRDFKKIAESVDVAQVVSHLGITLKGNRAQCPACQTEDPRSLQVYPDTNSFSCWAAKVSGDVISLWAHIHGYQGMYRAACEVEDMFLSVPGHVEQVREVSRGTAPQKPGDTGSPALTASPAPKKGQESAAPFDPDAYASKLTYTDEVKALGLSEADAATFQIGYATTGFHRGAVVFPIRHPSGEIAGFAGFKDGQFKFPRQYLPPKVVPLRRQSA